MKIFKICIISLVLLFGTQIAHGQLHIRVVSGQISLNDFAPTEAKYKSLTDTLDRKLKSNPNDTTSLFSRAVLYLQFNSFILKPGLTTNIPTENLLIGKRMSDRADSLQMKKFELKVLRAQICKELTYRYAPIENWRYNATQLATRKKKFDYYKSLTNGYYDELADLDKSNAYDYERLKVK